MAISSAQNASTRAQSLSIGEKQARFHHAASLPLVALQRGARVVLVNPKETPLLSKKADFLQGAAGTILPMQVRNTGWRTE